MSARQKISIAAALVFILGIGGEKAVFGKTYFYKESTSGNELTIEVEINKSINGYEIKSTDSNKDGTTIQTDQAFSTLKYDANYAGHGTSSAERSGNRILLSIHPKDETDIIKKELKISNLPWFQDWGLQLKPFILSDNKSTKFWTIRSGKWEAVKFEVEKENIEVIEINDESVEAIHAKISFTGLKKMLWSGDIWFRKSDGVHLLSKMNPFSSKDYKQFVGER